MSLQQALPQLENEADVAPPPTAYSVTLANQDITLHVDQMSIVINDTLGQGPGAGSSGATQGRAATLKMNTDLGPMSSAAAAPPRWFVREK